jgi:RNA polymerase sigma-70 factor (ECF subfamily)
LSRRDPLSDPAPLIRGVYAYAAYRVGHGPDAEDVTSEVFERALRYKESYDPRRGSPLAWLIGIARRCIDGRGSTHVPVPDDGLDTEGAWGSLEAETVDRMSVAAAVAKLDPRSQHLLALRYGADLSTREIGSILDLKKNAVEVALHRARERVRHELDRQGLPTGSQSSPGLAPIPSASRPRSE